MLTLATVLVGALAVSAAPTPEQKRQAAPFSSIQQPWNAGAVNEFRIHNSCNASQEHQLRTGLNEAIELAQHAKDHINRWGNESTIYRKYFGNAPTAEAIGALDVVVNGNKAQSIFRCDDPDGNCGLMPTWGGHWRGANASHETVICPASFFERRPLSTVCAWGYNVRESSRLLFWASDLLHRMYHLPEIGQGYIDHYAEGYEGILEAAANNSPNTTRDSDGLQYFALEAYAYDIIAPGEGCPGPSGPPNTSSTSSAAPAATSSTVSSATSVASAAASATSSAAASATTSAAAAADTDVPDNCHTHADGSLHCT
ncbi:Putative metallopeptidase, catalytic domain superfamily, peptidase domain, HRXXH [Septoria linicola]|uniref:Metallopeptidase, catalytic domain superfamily, peptidase domain, HRXXH n=1 Tax=Septoria linicola TaxID=215465 RepID=A0A9Q9AG84_9PEZI|nr:Putative metallopeptidase, catalytic domain superfamily, peptidase domain, HRXXH [Septoria linicola]